MSDRIASVADVARHLGAEAPVDSIVRAPQPPALVASLAVHWEPAERRVRVVAPLALALADLDATARAFLVNTVNRNLMFLGVELQDGIVVFVTHAFLDEEGSTSAAELDALLRAAADAASIAVRAIAQIPRADAHPPLDPEQGAALRRSIEKLKRLGHDASEVVVDRALLERAFARDLPAFAERVADATIVDAGTPFFAHGRVVRLQSDVPFRANAFAAILVGGPVVLTGDPRAFDVLCAEAPPFHVADDSDLAMRLAQYAAEWTSASFLGTVLIWIVDDIPFRRESDEDRAREAAFLAGDARRITMPQRVVDGDVVRLAWWALSESWLRLRTAEIRGGVIRVDETAVCELPVHPGRAWSEVAGRRIPVG